MVGFRFRAPEVEYDRELRWLLRRAFGPLDRGGPAVVDGERALALAVAHRLVSRVVARQGTAGLLAELGRASASKLVALHLGSQVRTRQLLQYLPELARVAARAGVPLAFLKLAALHLLGVTAPDGRPGRDIDVLVPKSAGGALSDALRAEGFEPRSTGIVGVEQHLDPVVNPVTGVVVEIHHSLPGVRLGLGQVSVTFETLRSAGLLEPIRRLDGECWVPCREVQVAYALVHGLLQHGCSDPTGGYPLFLVIADLVDLMSGSSTEQGLLERASRLVSGQLSEAELRAAASLATQLANNDESLFDGSRRDRLERAMLDHIVASACDPRYRTWLAMANVWRAPSDFTFPKRLLRLAAWETLLSRRDLEARYGKARSPWGLLGLRVLRPFDLLFRVIPKTVGAALAWGCRGETRRATDQRTQLRAARRTDRGMKLLFFAPAFPPPMEGGSIVYLYHIVSHLPPSDVLVATMAAPDAAEFDSAQRFRVERFVCKVGSWSKLRQLYSLVRWVPRVAALARREAADLLLTDCYYTTAPVAWVVGKFLGMPYLLYVYAEELSMARRGKDVWSRLKAHIYGRALRDAAGVVAVSEYTVDLALACGASSGKVVKVLPAVDPPTGCSAERLEEVRAKHGLQDGRRVILSVSRLIERKGQDYLIRSLPTVLGAVPNTVLVIVGRGEYEARLRRLASEVGVADKVVFAGYRPPEELSMMYELADVFAMPHRELEGGDTEGFGMVFAEAGAHGKPVVGGRAGGVRDAILDGETGFIVDGESVDEIARALVRLLRDPALARRLGENGRRRALGELTAQQCADKVRSFCKGLLEAAPPPAG